MDDNIKNRFKEGDLMKSNNTSLTSILFILMVIGFLIVGIEYNKLYTKHEKLSALVKFDITDTLPDIDNDVTKNTKLLNDLVDNNKKQAERILLIEDFLVPLTIMVSGKPDSDIYIKNSTQSFDDVVASEKYKFKSNWRKINTGSYKSQVREHLGEPERISFSRYGVHEIWTYLNKSSITFTASSGKVDSFVEPIW